ncbi:MAG: glycosyltransferase family 61 protein, partial [Chthoniobacterales bacterium]
MAMNLRSRIGKLVQDRKDPEVECLEIFDLATVAAERGWKYEEILSPTIQTCPGARALSEDFLQWAENGKHLLKIHRDSRRGLAFSRHWASLLHSVYRYPMDKVFRCALPGASVLSYGGGILSDRQEWVREAFFISRPLRQSQIPTKLPKVLEGKFISLLTIWGDRNLGHFFFDAMLRTAVFDDLENYKFLVPAQLHPWHRGLFEVAGIKPDQLVPIDNPFTRAEELHACHTSSSGSMPRRELLLKFRDRALKAAGAEQPPRRNRRIFVDRSGAQRRKLLNQKELEPILAERGFELVRWEEHSIAEQIRIASETEIMAGPHGTNLLNSLYCQPGAKLLEII